MIAAAPSVTRFVSVVMGVAIGLTFLFRNVLTLALRHRNLPVGATRQRSRRELPRTGLQR